MVVSPSFLSVFGKGLREYEHTMELVIKFSFIQRVKLGRTRQASFQILGGGVTSPGFLAQKWNRAKGPSHEYRNIGVCN